MTFSAVSPRPAGAADDEPIVRRGRNCWRVARANRAAVLIDGLAYFSAVADAIARAEHSVLIIAWDFNSLVRLHPEREHTDTDDQIGTVLCAALARRPELVVRVLDWDFSMIYALEREILPELRLAWSTPERFHFFLDNHHPPIGCHHQKIVVVDDALAFVGGFDFGAGRWDTREHRPDDPRRVDPWGKPYGPLHDLQMMVDGEAAAAVATLARERWRCATDERLDPAPPGPDPWPAGVAPHFTDVDVAIARTIPAVGDRPEVREIEALYVDAIAAARRVIYIENQYFTSTVVGAALETRLAEPDGPEVVVVLPRQCQGWLEETAMGVMRARLMRRLTAADRWQRLRLYYPDVEGLSGQRLTVHSKVLIVDDRLLRVGSANLNNRSMGLDTECDLAIDATGDARVAARIAALRDDLVAEHLGQPVERVRETLAAEQGSLIRTIEALSRSERGLRPLDWEVEPWLDSLVPAGALVDPERPVDGETLMAQLLPGGFEVVAARRRAWPMLVGVALGVAALTAVALIAL